MGQEDLIVAIHDAEKLSQGANDCLALYADGLKKGFEKIGVKTYSTKECIDNNHFFNLSIGFDNSCLGHLHKILSKSITNILWSTDSVFLKNSEIVDQFSTFEKFVLFEFSQADTHLVQSFYPTLKQGYIPVAVDPELCLRYANTKEYDIVVYSQIEDYNAVYSALKESMPPLVYELMMQVREIALNNPVLTFSQIMELIKKVYEMNIDKSQYLLLFKSLVLAIESEINIKMLKTLSDFNIKLFGNDLFKKYAEGSLEYCGNCSPLEFLDIMSKSKITIQNHPLSLGLGLQDRLLHGVLLNTFVLSSDSPSIKAEFNDSLVYYNHSTFEDLPDKINHYLKNKDEREKFIHNAKNIVLERHTWANRAQSILDIID